ncbi:3-dehydroquinate synthase, chloroplastic [Vitis vinifera]|uniref:3-dehydroquinate synthase, chloroplastic n=1 Tax=Vitis vinifera TaxID=29760 RepID=A0A438EVF6_VITVI|nr:3-dehydroquinate synthase, chloroplastic [Vitis vinifera]
MLHLNFKTTNFYPPFHLPKALRFQSLFRSPNPNPWPLPQSFLSLLSSSSLPTLLSTAPTRPSSTPVMDHSPSQTSPRVPTVVEVDLGNRSYPIYIGSGLLQQPELLQSTLYLDKVVDALTRGNPNISVESVILPDGEKYKNMTLYICCRWCGVIGDMCGFAAAAFLRGVNFIQIPTTVMAQVDSSVGGKTGINHPLGKNLIGAFYQPQCVLIDTDTLNTLPERELASASERNVMHENNGLVLCRDPGALAYAIKRSCENKAEVVSLDEKESGLRATLNLGHTFGHAIETGVGYGQWLHGEAVAAGMVMAVDMSYRLGWIDDSIVKRVHNIIKQAKLPITPPESMTVEMFKSVMAVRENIANANTFEA